MYVTVLHSNFTTSQCCAMCSLAASILIYHVNVCCCRSVLLQYCHYVAGVVGIGLSRLFSVSKVESAEVGANTKLSNSMGLFLQKTNIIRDYLEDVLQGRHFWPRQVSWDHILSKPLRKILGRFLILGQTLTISGRTDQT